MAQHQVSPDDNNSTIIFSAITSARQPIDSILKVHGTDIVDGYGTKVVLKGAGLGGQLNMENFITGYPGHEHEHRAAMLEVLGQEDYDFFFDKFLDYFFTASDAKFYASLGLNCIRIPFNYRHFEDDMNPGFFKPKGFQLLDRIVDHCAKENLYVILDLHAVPGGQNQDWHSDSGIHKALFWEFKDFQDRMVNLWVALARHYKGNPFVAGYNPLNEPADPQHSRLVAYYTRIESAIRAVDPDHILFLDGNTYAIDFSHFDTILPNCVYSIHDYSQYGFPMYDPYTGSLEQKTKLRKSFERKAAFIRSSGVPVWNGEFGPVWASASEPDHEVTNRQRTALLEEQLAIYRESDTSWSIWLYKDIGYAGMVYVDPSSPWMRLLKPFLKKKASLGVDAWGRNDKDVKHIYEPLFRHLEDAVPERFRMKRYPSPVWPMRQHINRVLRDMLLSEYLNYEMADYFKGKSKAELEELAASFKLENCLMRNDVNTVLQRDAAISFVK